MRKIIFKTNLFFALMLLFVSNVCAEDYSEDVTQNKSKEIEINDLRFWQDIDRVAENVTVITREEIDLMPVNNVAEVLRYSVGFSIDLRTGLGHNATFGMHGAESRHVRVMVDGVDFNNQASGQLVLSAIPIGSIKQIEIIKGSVSSKWGSALGGVINVVTRDTGNSLIPRGSFTTVIAEHSQQKYLGEIYGGIKNVGYYFWGEYADSNGWKVNEDVLKKNFMTKTSYRYKDVLNINASFGYLNSDMSDGPTPGWTSYRQNSYSRFGRLKFDYTPTSTSQYRLELKTNRLSDMNVTNDNSATRAEIHDIMYSVNFESVFRLRENDVLVFGAESQMDFLESLSTPNSVSMHSEALFGNYTLSLEPFSLSAGFRYDRHSDFDAQLSPSLGAVYEVPFLNDTRFRASFARGYSAPALLWIFYDNATFASNPGLKPEKSLDFAFGLESRPFDFFWTKVNIFYSKINDFISASSTSGGKYIMQNNSKFRKQGIEIETKFKLPKGLFLLANGAINDVEDWTTSSNVYSTSYVRNSANVGILYAHKIGFKASLMGNYQRFKAPGYDRHEKEMIWDIKVSQEYDFCKNYSVKGYLSVHNLFNSSRWHDEYYPQPKRYFEGGFSIYF